VQEWEFSALFPRSNVRVLLTFPLQGNMVRIPTLQSRYQSENAMQLAKRDFGLLLLAVGDHVQSSSRPLGLYKWGLFVKNAIIHHPRLCVPVTRNTFQTDVAHPEH